MSDQVKEGDKVSWSWGDSNPSGTVGEVKAGTVTVTSHRGNEISKTGTEDNPAVHIERSGNDVVKNANELNVTQKASSPNETNGATNGASDSKKEDDSEGKEPEEKESSVKELSAKEPEQKSEEPKADAKGDKAEAQSGDKRKADEETKESQDDKVEESESKKQKTTNGKTSSPAPTTANGEKKRPGRPKGVSGTKKEKKAPVVGRAERKTRSQGSA